MTQPAKVQEPSMEEILASIRRIIADDEARPAAAEKPSAPPPAAEKPAAAPPAKPVIKPVMKDIPPSAIPAAQAATKPAPAPAPPPRPAPPPPAPPAAVSNNSQDDIDAMLASLEAATPEADIRPPRPDGDVFELTDEMALPDPSPASSASSFHNVEPQDDIEFIESAGAGAALHRPPAYEPPPIETAPTRPILSRSTMNVVESAFNSLANTVLSNNARTLEDLVKEMLRPMLKSWLDDNLPGLVERIVKAEIERVSRGR
jgi:cell pole-organizing protein PopZ